MLNIVEVTENNNYLLNDFLKNDIPNTFRYFNKRTIDVLQNHIITVVIVVDCEPIGYAHIDYDSDKHWFGVCILDKYQGKGYGRKIMEYIFNHEKIKNIDKIYLTVDKINTIAISLYSKFDFNIINETETYLMMLKQ